MAGGEALCFSSDFYFLMGAAVRSGRVYRQRILAGGALFVRIPGPAPAPPVQAANAQGGIHIATGIACRAVLITGTTPEMPIGIIAGMRERGGLKKVSEIVAWSPVEVSPF